MMYGVINSLCKGLTVMTTAMMAKRAIQLGGIHWHKLMMLPTRKNISPQQKAELAILKLLQNPIKIKFLQSLDILFCDEMGQMPAELLSTVDIILRRVRECNTYLGGLLLIFTIDHTQIQPVEGRPFLTSSHMVPCFKMVALEESVRAASDSRLKRLQQIARYNNDKFESNPRLVKEFVRLCSKTFTFVSGWDDPEITPSTFRLYSRKVPAKDATKQFVDRVKRHIPPRSIRSSKAEDYQKFRFSHQEWSKASADTSSKLDHRLKEPLEILFFRGAIFECTFNEDEKFSQSQMAVLYDIPRQSALDNWHKVKILIAPLGLKDYEFNAQTTKREFLERGFKEVEIGVSPERIQSLPNNIKAFCKQYGLRHRVTSTIHAAMGDTLPRMATEISVCNSNFKMWDKGQMIVVISELREE